MQLCVVPDACKHQNHRGAYPLPLLCGYSVVFIPTTACKAQIVGHDLLLFGRKELDKIEPISLLLGDGLNLIKLYQELV